MRLQRDLAVLHKDRRKHHILVGKGTQTVITYLDTTERNLRLRATEYKSNPRTVTKYWVDPNDPWIMMTDHFHLIRGMDDDDLAKQLEIEKILATYKDSDGNSNLGLDLGLGWDEESENRIYAVIEEIDRRAGNET